MLVDNEETAAKVMDIAKRVDVRGANLNIYPLNWVEDDVEEVEVVAAASSLAGYGY